MAAAQPLGDHVGRTVGAGREELGAGCGLVLGAGDCPVTAEGELAGALAVGDCAAALGVEVAAGVGLFAGGS